MTKCEFWWTWNNRIRKCGKEATWMVGDVPCCLKHAYKYEGEFAKEKKPIRTGEQSGESAPLAA